MSAIIVIGKIVADVVHSNIGVFKSSFCLVVKTCNVYPCFFEPILVPMGSCKKLIIFLFIGNPVFH